MVTPGLGSFSKGAMKVYLQSRFNDGVWYAGYVPEIEDFDPPGIISFALADEAIAKLKWGEPGCTEFSYMRLVISVRRIRIGPHDFQALFPKDLDEARKIPNFVERELDDDR